MKKLLVFSNPFGYGPSGKALTVARYIESQTNQTEVIICGSKSLLEIAGGEFKKILVDDRNEVELDNLMRNISGECFVFSSQNRFAIKSALRNNIKCAFLDGLAWFWNEIPQDHFLADYVFWLNYPGVKDKVPTKYKDKIKLISGIGETDLIKSHKRSGILFYIGGCNNPLTPMPKSYLDLIAKVLEVVIRKNISIKIVSDRDSLNYLSKYEYLNGFLNNYSHSDFLLQVVKSSLFVTNGGQSASLEAVSLQTKIGFYLSANLSQEALQAKIFKENPNYPIISWSNFVKIPGSFYKLPEKEAYLLFIDNISKNIISNKTIMVKLSNSLIDSLVKYLDKDLILTPPSFLSSIGNNGAMEILKYLKQKWNLEQICK